jgi:hypothetical protein
MLEKSAAYGIMRGQLTSAYALIAMRFLAFITESIAMGRDRKGAILTMSDKRLQPLAHSYAFLLKVNNRLKWVGLADIPRFTKKSDILGKRDIRTKGKTFSESLAALNRQLEITMANQRKLTPPAIVR